MKPTMLISGGDTPLGNLFVERALNGGHNVVVTSSPPQRSKGAQRTKTSESKQEPESLLIVPWVKQSPVSARNVVLRCLSSFDTVDDAIIIHNLTREKRVLHELPIAFIQESIDEYLKSQIFLIKEIISTFVKKKGGSLSLVVNTEGSEVMSLTDTLLTSAFVTLSKSLITAYQNEPFSINGFESTSADYDDYASFVFSVLSNRTPRGAGRWYTHGQKAGLFRAGHRSRQ